MVLIPKVVHVQCYNIVVTYFVYSRMKRMIFRNTGMQRLLKMLYKGVVVKRKRGWLWQIVMNV
jgi:hypothetical protein